MPDNPALIRPARIDDDEHVWPLARDFATSFTPQRAAFDAAWAQLVGAPHTLLLVAESPERGIVGYLLGFSHLTFLANGPVAWVEEVMVDGRTRHSGVGRRLMEQAERWAQAIGAGYLALASRRAGPFYVALGYEGSAVFYRRTFDPGPAPAGPSDRTAGSGPSGTGIARHPTGDEPDASVGS